MYVHQYGFAFFIHMESYDTVFQLSFCISLVNYSTSVNIDLMTESPEIQNYIFFPQGTVLCPDKHLFLLKRVPLLWKRSFHEAHIYCGLSLLYLFICFCLPFNLKFCENREWFIYIYILVPSMGPCLWKFIQYYYMIIFLKSPTLFFYRSPKAIGSRVKSRPFDAIT